MKKISVLLALVALFFAEMALASAVATSVKGSVEVQTGTETPRVLRQGDEVSQGDTVVTAGNSAVVLKFDDGEIAALTSNSRMQITSYRYEPASQSGNVLLSLITGGMRAITGLIGRNRPDQVAYRAATATIGIRGTDVDMAVGDGIVAVTVNDGSITFTFNGITVNVPVGQGAIGANGQITPGAAQDVYNRLPPALQNAIGGLQGLTDAINEAVPGSPRQGQTGLPGTTGTTTTTTPTTGTSPGSTGGGSASQR